MIPRSLTVAYVTSRPKPEVTWVYDSLKRQMLPGDTLNMVVVDFYAGERQLPKPDFCECVVTEPKPNVWQGKHRLTKDHWWAASNARNTAICLCKSDWLACLDDRCVLMDGWLQAVKDAMVGHYAVCGTYQKRHSMTVENGVIRNAGIVTGVDPRYEYVTKHGMPNPFVCPGEWWFGCTTAVPIEWALQVNGYDEFCDGLGFEDVFFGLMLANRGYKVRFDTRMAMVEDRTEGKTGPVMVKRDKGQSPNDKSHGQLDRLRGLKRSTHDWDLRQVRDAVLAGKPWPVPTEPTKDWWDGQPLSEM